ncbi:MAG: AAA family ATPase [Deltaproteobacteria bacterium]|nr:AAA family ATPase [Deltaproteobacteria bacterium]
MKACDEHIRFVLLTGVSKFSKAGVFSASLI